MKRAPLILLLCGLTLTAGGTGALAQTLPAADATAPDTADTAQEAPALLVADRIFVTPDRKLIAEGNVEAFQGDTRLRAERITFDRADGKLTIEGPIRIDQGGAVTVLADSAQMDEGLQNGLLSGARLVLDQQLQMAALQMSRVGGRYTQLFKTSVTSCHVCDDGRPPLWQIRARKVIHDQLEKQLYFEGAQLRVLDVPIFYLPALRLPDPTLDRARGVLIPSIRTTSQLGTGLRVPYFIPLGDSRDLTLSPYVSSRTRTLDFRYRQAFRTGDIAFEGAFTRDDLLPGENRGYLFGIGLFDLPRDFTLEFGVQATSDNAYLVDYGLPNFDRLQNEIALTRVKRDSAFRASIINYKSLRDNEDDDLLPSLVADAWYERRIFPTSVGGELRLGLDIHAHHRPSDTDMLGRDIRRATADATWQRDWILRGGIRADWQVGLAADTFNIDQDSSFPANVTRLTPSTALKLSLPMTRVAASGATHFLEPVVQFGWTEVNGGDVPNDESTFVEFDRGNLLALSRFPAPDRREEGPTLVYGINWSRFAPSGWQTSATVGQVIRKTADPSFTVSSGLSGTSSDILVAGQIRFEDRISLTARSLVDGAFSLSKAELRGDWRDDRTTLSSTYIWLGADPAEGRIRARSEFWFDGSYEISPSWTAGANLRYDVSDNRATTAGVGLIYTNECVTVDLSVNRRYTSSTSVEPSTDFGFSIALRGFAVEAGTEKYRRSCS